MKRGEIYYIKRWHAVGSELTKDRPAIIVSNDGLNNTSEQVLVVYLTSQPKKDTPTHATIESTGRTSTALCENIDTIHVSQIDNFCGRCTEEEMAAVDAAMLAALGIEVEEGVEVQEGAVIIKEKSLLTIVAERDVYKSLVDKMLGVAAE